MASAVQPASWKAQGLPYQHARCPARPPLQLSHSWQRLHPNRCSISAPMPASSPGTNDTSQKPPDQQPSGEQNETNEVPPEIEPLSDEASEAFADPNMPQEPAIWCLGAPSATASLRHIRDDLYHLSGRNTTMHVNNILRRDPEALASRSSNLRALVATLIDLRESPPSASTSPTGDPAPLHLRPWNTAPLERSLYTGEVRRVHRDLLKSQPELQHLATAREALAAALPPAAPQDPPKEGPRWLKMLTYALFLPDIARAFKWLKRSIAPHIMFPDFSLWSLRTVQRFADELPHDAELQAALLRRLNAAGRHSEVVQRVASGAYKTSNACEVEYLAAMVHTGSLEHFRGEGPPPVGVPHNNLPRLLEEVRLRLVGRAAGGASGAATGGVHGASGASRGAGDVSGALTGALLSGAKESAPLHVRLQNLPNAQPNALMAAFRSVFSFFATLVVIMTLWVIGAAAEGTLQARGSLAGNNGALTEKPGGSHAPKEYNKENIPEASLRTFADVKGVTEAKEELQEVVEYLKNPAKFIKLGAKLPKGVLLSGPPGTGKTLLARAVAGEAGVPFFYRAGSEFEEMFVGVGSRRVRQLFQAAKARTPCIIFIDEIDAVGSNRRSWENHSRKTLNQILTEMDGFEENAGIIVIAATNLPEVLDPALTRPGRFDRHVTIDLPDIKGRKEILEHYLKGKPLADDVDGQTFAAKTPGFSGAQLANMINEAALFAAKSGAEAITADMLEEARDKVMMGRERSLTRTEKSIRHTAYHEAGHALVALFTPGADPLHKATINPRGPALGLTWQMPPADEYSRSLTQLRASVDVCMGGQVAETLAFGPDEVGAGATSDLKQATKLARHMVCDCGFSEAIGPMCVDESASQATQQVADKEVLGILQGAKGRVKGLLRRRITELHAVATALITQETLDHAQISAICQKASEDSSPEASPFGVEGATDASPLPA